MGPCKNAPATDNERRARACLRGASFLLRKYLYRMPSSEASGGTFSRDAVTVFGRFIRLRTRPPGLRRAGPRVRSYRTQMALRSRACFLIVIRKTCSDSLHTCSHERCIHSPPAICAQDPSFRFYVYGDDILFIYY